MVGKHRRGRDEPQDEKTKDPKTKPKFKPLSGKHFPGSVEEVDEKLGKRPRHGLSSGKHRKEDNDE